jgi:hypothetical protein
MVSREPSPWGWEAWEWKDKGGREGLGG